MIETKNPSGLHPSLKGVFRQKVVAMQGFEPRTLRI